MKKLLSILLAASPLLLTGCANKIMSSDEGGKQIKEDPGAPAACRDDENFEGGRCVPRVQGQP